MKIPLFKNETGFSMSYYTKVIIFIVLNVWGYLIQFGSFGKLLFSVLSFSPQSFAFSYTLGNILSLTGTLILIGFNKLKDVFLNPKRRITSIIFLISMILCGILPFLISGIILKILLFTLIAIQIIFYWLFVMSFIPFARTLLQKIIPFNIDIDSYKLFN